MEILEVWKDLCSYITTTEYALLSKFLPSQPRIQVKNLHTEKTKHKAYGKLRHVTIEQKCIK